MPSVLRVQQICQSISEFRFVKSYWISSSVLIFKVNMSSKKNKKKTKPHPTPQLQAKEEENTEIVQEKIERPLNLEQQSAIETSGEVAIVEVKSEDDTPKKPKRNKGKNKKQDIDEELKEENKPKETGTDLSDILISEDVVSVANLDIKLAEKLDLDSSDNKCLECETVTPTIRKKKNKKKEHKTNIENLSSVTQKTASLKENEEPKIHEKVTGPVKFPEIDCTKKSIKKNKKKNRNDSETSDKVEIISDTSTVQMLNETADEKSAVSSIQGPLKDENVIVAVSLTTEYAIKQDSNSEEIVKESNEEGDNFKEELLKAEESSPQEFPDSKIEQKGNVKNRKTNKKDKKQKKEIPFDDNKGEEQLKNQQPMKKEICMHEEMLKDKLQDNKIMLSNMPEAEAIGNESINDPNSKIAAKPVEIKNKAQEQFHELEKKEEEVLDHENNKSKHLPDKNVTANDSVGTLKSKDSFVSEDIKLPKTETVNKDVNLVQDLELIKVPDNVMGKKRKKSPKGPKLVISESIAHEEEIAGAKETFKLDSELHTDNQKSVVGTKTEVVPHIEPNTDNNKRSPEPKSRKKGKKSPKIPLTPGVTDFTPTFDTDSKTSLKIEASVTDEIGDKKISTLQVKTAYLSEDLLKTSTISNEDIYAKKDIIDIPFIDSEVTVKLNTVALDSTKENNNKESLKAEENLSEAKESHSVTDSSTPDVKTPTLDVIPDIQYPRSTSQENDTNNNTVIREVRPDELQLPSVKDTPVIQGSGETPIGTPQMIVSDIVIYEIPDSDNRTEKTDLKSKMLEVNRDMEELRMSIERSLAEFTTLEKNEEKIEKEYEDKMITGMIKSETDFEGSSKSEITNIEVKLKEDIKDPSITESKIEDATKTKEVTPSKLDEDLSCERKDTETLQSLKEQINDSIFGDSLEFSPVSTDDSKIGIQEKIKNEDNKPEMKHSDSNQPIFPHRKDNKGKNKKKKGKQEMVQTVQPLQGTSQASSENTAKESSSNKKSEKPERAEENNTNSQKENKQQPNTESLESSGDSQKNDSNPIESTSAKNIDYEPIENFEDALTSSTEDVDINKSFDMIVNEENLETQRKLAENKPEIKIIGPDEKPKEAVTPSKNLLGSPNIPVPSNKTDYKKEKNKTPNTKQAKVKIKDSVDIEVDEKSKNNKTQTEFTETIDDTTERPKNILDNQLQENHVITKENGNHQNNGGDDKQSTENMFKPERKEEVEPVDAVNKNITKTKNKEKRKSTESQTENRKNKSNSKNESLTQLKENEEFVYKYSFRKVFLQNACNVCKKELKLRVQCNYCNLLFYCSNKHKDEDWPQHQALCFAISTIGHLKGELELNYLRQRMLVRITGKYIFVYIIMYIKLH